MGVSGGGRVGSKGATLDDLCRAVEALEKMENGGGGGGTRREEDEDKRRPGNIHIPAHTSPSLERHRLGSSPPYTPPPILSPARSMAMLSTVPGTMFVHTYIHAVVPCFPQHYFIIQMEEVTSFSKPCLCSALMCTYTCSHCSYMLQLNANLPSLNGRQTAL